MYTLSKKTFTQLKSQLTRAKNSGDPRKVLEACEKAFDIFEREGYPDNWHNWERAREDAIFEIRRADFF